MADLDHFFDCIIDMDEYLWANSIEDIAFDSETSPEAVKAWLIANEYIREGSLH